MRPEEHPQDWHIQKTYESMIAYGLNAIKFTLVANGGAILSILTFIGNHPEKIKDIKFPIFIFCVGVVMGGLCNITAYLTQITLFNQRENNVPLYRNHVIWLYTSIIFIIVGTLCFAIGAFGAANALNSLKVDPAGCESAQQARQFGLRHPRA